MPEPEATAVATKHTDGEHLRSAGSDVEAPGHTASARSATATERRFWALDHTSGTRAAAATFAHYRLAGPLDLTALTRALRAVRQRHQALRTAYTTQGATLVAQVLDRPPEHEPLLLPTGTTPSEAVGVLRRTVGFDTAAADLLRWGVGPLPDGADLYLAVHHIAFDGASGEVLAKDLARAYATALAGRDPHLPAAVRGPAPTLDPGSRAALERHWREALSGVGDLPDGGRDLTRRDIVIGTLVQCPVQLDRAAATALRERARAAAVTPFAVLLACYARALATLADARDFAIGTAVADRPAGTEEEVGCRFTMVPVAVRDPLAEDCVTRVWDSVVDCVLHAALPLEDVVRVTGRGRSRRMPLYQATFLLQNWPRREHRAGPVTVHSLPVPPTAPQAEVLLELYDDGEGPVHGVLQAPDRSVWADRLQLLADHWHREARPVAAGPG
ncbi:MAG: condensation domain-containing protein [Streptomyces sp.]